MSLDEPRFERRAVDRLLYFSDAVAAIAITLLAIDLPAPRTATAAQLWSSFRQLDDRYLAFLVSFYIIAAAWSHHREIFRYIVRVDTRLRTLAFIWLLMIVLIPFAAKLLAVANGEHDVRYAFYALLQVLISASMLIMARYATVHDLVAPDAPPPSRTDADWQSYGILLGFGISIPVFFLTSYAWILWFAVPALTGRVRKIRMRGQEGKEDTEAGNQEGRPGQRDSADPPN
jgi:uncharacterized membrane protein